MVTVDEYSIKDSPKILWLKNPNGMLGYIDGEINGQSVLFLCYGNTNWEAVHNCSSTNRSKPIWYLLIFFLFIWMSSIKATLFISFLFHILLCIFLCYQAFWNLRKLSSHIWLLAETMTTLFLFLLNLHVCHLLDCLFFYKINCNRYSVLYIYSALEFLKQFQSFCFQDCVLPLCPIHTHPLWE